MKDGQKEGRLEGGNFVISSLRQRDSKLYFNGNFCKVLDADWLWCLVAMVHSKNTRVSVTRKRVHWGQTPFRVKDDPEIGQLSADLTTNGVRLTQLWVTFRIKLTDFRVIVDPEWSLAPMDPFRVNF